MSDNPEIPEGESSNLSTEFGIEQLTDQEAFDILQKAFADAKSQQLSSGESEDAAKQEELLSMVKSAEEHLASLFEDDRRAKDAVTQYWESGQAEEDQAKTIDVLHGYEIDISPSECKDSFERINAVSPLHYAAILVANRFPLGDALSFPSSTRGHVIRGKVYVIIGDEGKVNRGDVVHEVLHRLSDFYGEQHDLERSGVVPIGQSGILREVITENLAQEITGQRKDNLPSNWSKSRFFRMMDDVIGRKQWVQAQFSQEGLEQLKHSLEQSFGPNALNIIICLNQNLYDLEAFIKGEPITLYRDIFTQDSFSDDDLRNPKVTIKDRRGV
ncbi:MAG: hypothetical protein NT039_04460 [Candidatus Berkelbacteria bacterium]|nr:hypothetical protein [Candidatus Berkelbacteria bacterium]